MFDLDEKKMIWVVGSLERLGSLGYFKEIGYRVDEDCVDLYWELDDIRNDLIEDEEIFLKLVVVFEESNLEFEQIKEIYDLVIQYKNDRSKTFAYAMEKILMVK